MTEDEQAEQFSNDLDDEIAEWLARGLSIKKIISELELKIVALKEDYNV